MQKDINPLTAFGVPLLFTKHDRSRFWYPPITSISSAVGYLFFPVSLVLLGAGVGILACGAALGVAGVPVGMLLVEAAPAGLLGVIVIVVPLFPGPPEALLMEKRGGDGVEEGDAVQGEDDDGELCSGGFVEFSVDSVFRALIVNDLTCWGLVGGFWAFCWACGNLELVGSCDFCVSLNMSGLLAARTSGSTRELLSMLVCAFLLLWGPHPASCSLSCSRSNLRCTI